MSHTLNIRFRTLLLLGVTLLALAMSSTAAFAGEDDDGDDEDDAPVPTHVAPAPVPVKPAPAAQPQSKPTTPTQAQHSTRSAQSRQVSSSTGSTVQSGQAIPRGGVDTGAGGAATEFTETGPSPVVLGLGALLAFLLFGRGVRLARARA